jgi:urocanate hydratase
VCIDDVDKAIDQALGVEEAGVAKSIGVTCNVVDLLQRLIARKVTPDVLTDQTSAHDPLGGYVPNQVGYAAALEAAPVGSEALRARSRCAR